MDNIRSNSLTSVNRFQKLDQNKDNYENTYESETFPSTNGFNTLPSLKKRNQTRASDIFQNETTSAYYFSSAENLGCSENNDGRFRNENLPPRVSLVSDTPRSSTPRYGTGDASGFTNSLKSDSEPQSDRLNNLRTSENGNSFVKKLFVSCSPTKQKNLDADKSLAQVNKKKTGKRLASNKDSDPGNDNVITFHYRLGIPRSPNIQNFAQFTEKNCENGADDCGTSENAEESQKILKGIKYVSKDVELLQKHGSLMKEFNKNVDLQKNLKYKSEKSSGRSNYAGVDNKGFQNMEDCPRTSFPRTGNYHSPQEYKAKSSRLDAELEKGEEYPSGNMKNENESDVYFGDISNSSCYISVQNEGADSSLYEEAVEHRNGQSLLNKQNLKRIEDESVFNGMNVEYDREHSESQTYSKLQNDPDTYQQNYRSRRSNLYRLNQEQMEKKEEARPGPSEFKAQDVSGKAQRRSFLLASNFNDHDNKNKYLGCYQDHFRPEHYQETSISNDEHSSSSLTVDSGISTGRNYLPRCYGATYQELDCPGKENQESRQETCFETLNERFSNIEKFQKISNLESLTDFSHPLFQKPKVVPRGNRYKDLERLELRQKKIKSDPEAEAKRSSFGSKMKPDDGQFVPQTELSEETYQKVEEVIGKSPKPLPRTSVAVGSTGHVKYSQKEKHFLAPDAQYEYKDDFNSEFKQKTQPKKVDGKPVVPARPLNLQERCRNTNFGYCKTDGGCPLPRRRRQHGDDGKDSSEVGNHSVNV